MIQDPFLAEHVSKLFSAPWHPEQLRKWTEGERETNWPENFLLLGKSTSLLKADFTLLAAVWCQMTKLVSQRS